MINLASMLKSKDITLLTNVPIVKTMYGFPVVMHRCESWTIKKAKHQRVDTFKLCYWRRFLRVFWTARRSNQSVLKEVNPECSLEDHLMQRANSLEKTVMLGKIEGKRRRGNRG